MIHGGFFKVGGKSSPVNVQNAKSLIDFSDAVITHDGTTSLATVGYMIVPRGTTSQRNSMVNGQTLNNNLTTVAMFFDTDIDKLCVYQQGDWVGVATVAIP